MDASLDLKLFQDSIESMKRILINGKQSRISSVVFSSAVATVNEICLRRIKNIEASSEIKYNIDELKKSFENYEKFFSLSIGTMYLQRCAEKVESLDNLYKNNLEEKIINKFTRIDTTNYAPGTIGSAKRYDGHNYTNTSFNKHEHDESNYETKLEKIQEQIVNNYIQSSVAENIFKTEPKSTIIGHTTTVPLETESANVKKITESKNEKSSQSFDGSSVSSSSTFSSVEEEEFQNAITLETKQKGKTQELAKRMQEISASIEEGKDNKITYQELQLVNKEFEKRQDALRAVQDEVFIRLPQKLTEMLSYHQLLIEEEFAELKSQVKNMNDILLTTIKDLRQHIKSQEVTINLLKNELQSLEITMKEALKKKDEEIGHVVNHLNDLLKAKDECRFCSFQTYQKGSRDKETKARTPDKVQVEGHTPDKVQVDDSF